MPDPADSLFALIAVQLGFASREALRDPESVQQQLPPAARAAVQAAVAAHVALAKGDFERAIDSILATQERDRALRLAEDCVGRAREAIARYYRLKSDGNEGRGKRSGKGDKGASKASVEAFCEADAALAQALSHDRGNREARQLLADLYRERLQEAEKRGDERETRLHRAMVERFSAATDLKHKGPAPRS